MLKYVSKRIIYTLMIFLGVTVLVFIFGIMSPGDPAELALSRGGAYQPTDDQIEVVREKLGLNVPYHKQYINWIKGVFKFDFGNSYSTNRRVTEIFKEKLPYTLKLGMFSIIITIIFGVSSGINAAKNYNSILDYIIQTLQNVFLSMPQFWIGLLLILLFSEKHKILPSNGVQSIKHYILPSLTLSLVGLSNISRLTRSSFLSEFGKHYYLFGKARAISKRKLVYKHTFKNAILPVLPMIGNYIGGILGGSSIVEIVFGIPGLGSFAVNAILLKDIPVIQAYVLFSSAIYLFTYMTIDLISISLNPKLKGQLNEE